MTFRGNLLLYSLWYELHPFENLRRKGHHCHGLTHLSWAERKIFYRVLGKKFCGLFIYPGQSVRRNLLLYSLWYELHPFENLRRKGHHCHGLTHLSWAERKIFYRVLGKKFCGLFIYPGQSVRQVVAVSAPGDRDSYGCVAPGRQ